MTQRRTGAKQQTFSERNPRELLIREVRASKHGNREILLSNFKKAVRENPDYFDAIVDYWFSNNLTAIGADEQFPVNTLFTLHARKKAEARVASKPEHTKEDIDDAMAEIRARREEGEKRRAELEAARLAEIQKNSSASKPAAIKLLQRYSNIVLMSLMTPVGKKLGDLTGVECAALGGWYETVGTMAGSSKIAEALTENDLQTALDRA